MYAYQRTHHHTFPFISKISKVGDLSRGWTEGSLFNSYHTEV